MNVVIDPCFWHSGCFSFNTMSQRHEKKQWWKDTSASLDRGRKQSGIHGDGKMGRLCILTTLSLQC
jgi:hypothetical protein